MADDQSLEATYAAEYVKSLLSGDSLNGAVPESFGAWRDVIDHLVQAHAAGGTSKVREAWNDHVRRHPEDVELAAGDHPEADDWRVYTLADAYTPRPCLRYVVEGLCPLPSVSIMYGAPGSLKSFLLADLAVCVAGGLPWLPTLPGARGAAKPTLQAPALWCDFDNGPRITHERFEALGRARTLAVTAPLFLCLHARARARCQPNGGNGDLSPACPRAGGPPRVHR
jgi:hypothetical protein